MKKCSIPFKLTVWNTHSYHEQLASQESSAPYLYLFGMIHLCHKLIENTVVAYQFWHQFNKLAKMPKFSKVCLLLNSYFKKIDYYLV